MNVAARIVTRTDALDLFETLRIAGYDIAASADSIYLGDRINADNSAARASAKAAAERVLRALKEYENQIETMEVVS
jgi:hypothetical protein